MSEPDLKDVLQQYLQRGREALLFKLEGLSEYDLRRPMTPTGGNLVGIVKHVASVEAEYLGVCFGRPFPHELPHLADDAEPNANFWATAAESSADIINLYHRVSAHSDETIAQLDLDTIGEVAWWPAERRHPSLGLVLTHMTVETHRHAGHIDVVRELIDGSTGLSAKNSNLPDWSDTDWAAYRDRLETLAQQAK